MERFNNEMMPSQENVGGDVEGENSLESEILTSAEEIKNLKEEQKGLFEKLINKAKSWKDEQIQMMIDKVAKLGAKVFENEKGKKIIFAGMAVFVASPALAGDRINIVSIGQQENMRVSDVMPEKTHVEELAGFPSSDVAIKNNYTHILEENAINIGGNRIIGYKKMNDKYEILSIMVMSAREAGEIAQQVDALNSITRMNETGVHYEFTGSDLIYQIERIKIPKATQSGDEIGGDRDQSFQNSVLGFDMNQ